MVDSLREKPLAYLGFLAIIFTLAIASALYLPGIPWTWILGIILTLAIFLLIFFKLEWAPYLLIISMAQSFELPIQTSWAGKLPIFTDDIILSMIIFAWLIRQVTAPKTRWVETSLNRPLLVLIAVALLSLIYSGFYFSGQQLFGNFLHLVKWTEYMFVFFLTINLVTNKKQARALIVTFIAAAVLVALYAIFEKVTGKGLHTHYTNIIGGERVTTFSSTFETGHELGAFLAMPIVLLASFIFGKNRWELKVLLIGVLLLLGYVLLSSMSRTSYIGVYFALMILGIFKKKPGLIGILLAFIPVFFLYFPEQIINRIKFTFEQGFGLETNDRIIIWIAALKIYVLHPFLGIGYWNSYSSQYFGVGPHNSFIQTLLEMGALGFATFIWLIHNLYVGTKRIFSLTKDSFTKDLSAAFFALLIGFLFASMTAEVFYWSRVIGYFWFLAGLVFVLKRMELGEAEKKVKLLEGR